MKAIVKVSDLLAKIQKVADDGMAYVKLDYLIEELETDGIYLPSILLFQAIKESNIFEIYDYEYIDVYNKKKF